MEQTCYREEKTLNLAPGFRKPCYNWSKQKYLDQDKKAGSWKKVMDLVLSLFSAKWSLQNFSFKCSHWFYFKILPRQVFKSIILCSFPPKPVVLLAIKFPFPGAVFQNPHCRGWLKWSVNWQQSYLWNHCT